MLGIPNYQGKLIYDWDINGESTFDDMQFCLGHSLMTSLARILRVLAIEYGICVLVRIVENQDFSEVNLNLNYLQPEVRVKAFLNAKMLCTTTFIFCYR